MRRFLVRFRKFKDVVVALLVGIGLLRAILFLERFESFTQPQRSSLILMCFFLAATTITAAIDLKKGLERRIEVSVLFLLVSLVALIFSFIIEDLIQAGPLEFTRTAASILAGAIALFGLTIAFLNYKRKAGVAIEYSVGCDENKNPVIYFSNLKDRAVVIYEFMVRSGNLEVEMPLGEYIVLGSYDVKAYKVRQFGGYHSLIDSKKRHKHESSVMGPVEDYPIYSLEGSKIRARTSLGETYIERATEVLLMPEKEIYLSYQPFQIKPIEEYSLGRYEEFAKWEIVKKDDPRIIRDIGNIKFMRSRGLADIGGD